MSKRSVARSTSKPTTPATLGIALGAGFSITWRQPSPFLEADKWQERTIGADTLARILVYVGFVCPKGDGFLADDDSEPVFRLHALAEMCRAIATGDGGNPNTIIEGLAHDLYHLAGQVYARETQNAAVDMIAARITPHAQAS